MLADLHLSTPPSLVLRRRGFDVPGRDEFEAALEDLGRRWNGGPLSERARRVLAGEVELVRGWLRDLDRFAAGSEVMDRTEVVTHGEPHPGNLIRTAGRLRLVDWDTVALARPERDLWMIDDVDPGSLDAYRGATGLALDRDALVAGRLLWALTDLAAFTEQLRREHRGNEDDDWALPGLRTILSGDEPRPYQLARSPETHSR